MLKELFGFLVLVITAILFIIGLVFGWQNMKVYVAQQTGKAAYAEADQNRQIKIVEAVANNEAATSNALAKVKIAIAEAEAEIERAKGVAEANRIIGEGLKENENYLRYLWIEKVAGSNNQVIYIPSENGLPLLEAGKR
jgi:regulator of protease activity HflC (stomatin/prohibitin superfamily)